VKGEICREAAQNFLRQMAFAFFKIPCNGEPGPAEELNAFLRSHQVLAVHREWESAGDTSFWAFCVHYREGGAATTGKGVGAGPKIDYKEVLTETQFALYVKLRDLRKRLAERDGTPVFAIFTNEQLAEMTKGPARSLADLKAIAGVGEARIAKFGTEILSAITDHAPGETAL
jgi:superfamily II DNA helicase RecQ